MAEENKSTTAAIDARLKQRWANIMATMPGYKQYEGPAGYSAEEREQRLAQRRRDLLKNIPGYKQG